MIKVISDNEKIIEINNKISVVAIMQDLLNRSEARRELLINHYSKAVFTNKDAASVLVNFIDFETGKINAYKQCTALLINN